MAQDRFSLAGKNAVVTGGAQGIGKVVAHALAEQGANVALVDLNDATQVAAEIASTHGVRTTALTCNVTDPAQVADAIAGAAAELGPLDLLFNNAGIVLHKPALECTPEDFTRVVDVNLNGIFFVAQAFARHLVEQGRPGNIVNTASMSGTIVNIPQPRSADVPSLVTVSAFRMAVERRCGVRAWRIRRCARLFHFGSWSCPRGAVGQLAAAAGGSSAA